LLVVQYGSTIGGAGAGNTATGDGGGIYNTTGASTGVNGSSVSANTADRGAGIYNQAQLNVIDGSTIGGAGAGNTADTFGGGIYNETGTTTVDGSTVSANTAIHGGGVDNQATLNVQNRSTIGGAGAGNAGIEGGGINNGSGGTTTVAGSTVSGNTAGWGGGIFNRATLNVQNGSIIGGAGAGNTVTSSGGGIYNLTGITTLERSIVSANTATDGGGIYVEAGAMIVDGSTVNANTADNGGGIYNKATPLKIQNGSTIGGAGAGNTATGDGGGIYNETGTTTVVSSTVSANAASDGGGGIYNSGSTGTTTVDGSTVSANVAGWGGGIVNLNATLNVQNGSTIGGIGVGNTVTSSGGGIYNTGSTGATTVHESTVSANTADSTGGGIYNFHSALTVTGSRILHNTAIKAGGVSSSNTTAGATSVTGSCIVGNSATSFVNLAAQSIATGDWWGAATGPNTPGGDTVAGNVDTSGYLTEPILGCTPDLQVTKANDMGGETTVGTPFHWTLTISNAGLTDAVFNTGQRILVDDLPAGPAYGTPTVADLVNVTGGANIDCSIADNSLTCEAGGGGVTVETAGSFAVGFSVTSGEAGALSNPAGVCQVDPDGNVDESDENNNCPTDTLEVTSHSIYLPLVVRNASGP
jgi:hypothetical protein